MSGKEIRYYLIMGLFAALLVMAKYAPGVGDVGPLR
jgi:hypothetical protein